ncbi:MAG TPA: alpha/beta fold hydrolase [Gemmatimonadales bacterium]|nr:alpha/beta fold hydrolase [Gemmatimonadales bacterium]
MTSGSRLPLRVLLVHGMGRTPLSLHRLSRDLNRCGFDPCSTGYLASLEPFRLIVRRIRNRLADLGASSTPYAVVSHSLGGLLVRAALARIPVSGLPAHLIMLGTPHRPPRLAQRYHRQLAYRLVNGETGQLLAQPTFFDELPPLSIPYTIIAGTKGWTASRGPFAGEPNDGIVALSETLVCSTDQPVVLPVRHTFMMNDRRVREVIRTVLERVSL